MVRLLKQLLSSEKGQALAIVLGLLAIGGLTIAVSLNYATTSLKGSGIVEENMKAKRLKFILRRQLASQHHFF